jgi:hypothetical protein
MKARSFEEEKKRLSDALQLQKNGKNVDAIKKLLENDYLKAIRDRDMKIKALEDELRRRGQVQMQQQTSNPASRSSSIPNIAGTLKESGSGDLRQFTEDEINQLKRAASFELKNTDTDSMLANKERFDLLSAIVSLTRYDRMVTNLKYESEFE